MIAVDITPYGHEAGNDDEISDFDIMSPDAQIRCEISLIFLDDIWP